MRQDLKEIGSILRGIRKEKGLLQKDMLEKIGMSQQQYQGAEAGKDIRLSTLLRILEGFDMKLAIVPAGQGSGTDESLFEESENFSILSLMKDLED